MEGAAITRPTVLDDEEYVASFLRFAKIIRRRCVYKSALRDKFARDNEFPLPLPAIIRRRNDGVPFEEEHRPSIKRSAAGNSGKRFRSAYCAPPPSLPLLLDKSRVESRRYQRGESPRNIRPVCLETRRSIHFPWDSILLSGGG